jgi:hypothetical protein
VLSEREPDPVEEAERTAVFSGSGVSPAGALEAPCAALPRALAAMLPESRAVSEANPAVNSTTPTCGRGRRYLMADLVRFWPNEALASLLRRMVCQVCGCGVLEARLIRERPMRPREPDVVALCGRGVPHQASCAVGRR